MSISPLITFKAGICELNTSQSPAKVVPQPTSGYIYLYEEDELINFCWRRRSAPMSQPDLKLVMVPTDGQFVPYNDKTSGPTPKSPTNGRIFVLKFQSSTQRHLFWLQSQTQHVQGDPTHFSPRDLKIGWIVDRLLQGDEVNVSQEVANIPNDQAGNGDDQTMEDAAPDSSDNTQGNNGRDDASTGNPGSAREGAGSGDSATISPGDAATAVQNFLRSIQNQPSQSQQNVFTTLTDLLPPSTTLPFIDLADPASVNSLLNYIPPVPLLFSQEADDTSSVDPNFETVKGAVEALSLDQKKAILRKVLRSPQFSQSLSSLTAALRNGGLPTISEALKIAVKDGGFINRGGMPLEGGDAVEAFLGGLKSDAEKADIPSSENIDID
ncbi:hypothetical protein ACLMJK_004196 [Lecanora helva]